MSAPTVLVLGVGGNVSQGILKALRLAAQPPRVVAACVTADAVGMFEADRAYRSPYAADPEFIPWLMRVCERERVAAVLSGSEPVLAALAPAAAELSAATGTVAIVSPTAVLEVGIDKLAGCRWLAGHGFPHPHFAEASDRDAVERLLARAGLPLIAKPRRGRGAQGVVEIADEAALSGVRGRRDIVLQEMLGSPDEEYTVGCFCDSAGVLRGSVAMRRVLAHGTTVRADLGDFEPVRTLSERIVTALGPLGPCNVQLRMRDGAPVPFELNVRFSGTTPMRARHGFNEVEEAVRHLALGEPARNLARPRSGTVLRYWNELYVPSAALAELEREGQLATPRGAGAQIEDWGIAQ